MKELNDETTVLLESLRDRATLWEPNPRLVVWVFYVGEEREVASAWLKKQGLHGEVFSMVYPKAEGIEAWNLDAAKSNVFVLGGTDRTIKRSWTDVTAEEMKGFGATLSAALK